MSKHRHQSKEEQINNRIYAAVQSNQDTLAKQGNSSAKSKADMKKPAINENSTRFLAYQIHVKKGGSALDNWLEAERYLNNGNSTEKTFLNEGKPQVQRSN